jgi:hypothetical protein
VIARLAGLAIDARFATQGALAGAGEAVARARAARWIAANALAVRGVPLAVDGALPDEPQVFALRAASFFGALAAIAAVPVLIDGAALPCGWRLALRALGLPMLDRPAAAAIGEGACVLSADARGLCELGVDRESHGFRVRVGAVPRMLVA